MPIDALLDSMLAEDNSAISEQEEWHSSIQPRDYQLALFLEALQDNSFVMLETGTGKTLVSVMLIQWFARRAQSIENHKQSISSANSQNQRKRRKIRVFLNNTVDLVYQQARVISENTNQQVDTFVGSMGINDWDDKVWSKQWDSVSVLVMTHQVLLNALRAGRARLADIDLLIFDECHHARGNHPYALIMREFYDRCDPASRPHVFGMTASPLNSKETASESVQNLQAVLDSRLCTVDLTARTDSLGSKQIHLCYEYRLSPEFPQTQLTMAIEEQCRGCQTIEPASKLVAYVLPSLGPYGVDQMWHHFIRQWHRRTLLRPATTDRPVNPPLNPPASLSCSPISTPAERPSSAFQQSARGSSDADQLSPDLSDVDRYFDARDAVQQQQYMDEYGCSDKDAVSENIEDISFLKQALTIDNMFGGKPYRNLDQLVGNQTDAVLIGTEKLTELDADHASDMHPTPLLRALSLYRKPWDQLRSQLSPQVNRLFGILYQWRDRPKDLRGIVFTSRRITAVLLVYIISQISEFSYIQSEVLLGGSSKQNSSIANRPIRGGSVRAANQAVLADFAKGRLNLIFATQVAEEGVDIQPCNLVIRFDMPDTATSLIQSRGRARMSGSQFIVMVPEIDAEQKASAATASTATAIADADAGQSSSSEISKTNPMVVTWESESDQESDAGHLNMALDKSSRSSSNRQKTYADYLRLVSLEECLREWCLVAATKHEGKDSGNVIISSRTHEEYGCRLRRMRMLLTIESSSYHLEATVQDEPWIERRDSTGRIYTIKSTNACITYLSASSIVQRYIQLLPQDDYFKLQLDVEYEQKTVEQPRPQENTAVQDGPSTTLRKKQPKPAFLTIYRCVLSLPSNAALRKVVGPYMPKKKLAKQAAVYRAAKKLHQLGAIDDNLIPACSVSSDINDVADEPELSAETAKTKGVRASVQEYSIAMPSAFISPLPRTDTAGSGYVPFAWHIYKIKLDHPLSTTCLELAIATAQSLPPDTAVPLYIDQYAKGKTDLDTTQSLICPMYIGKQTLEYAQVDALASFSSKLLMRVTQMALVWETEEIGFLMGPLLSDGTGIDLDLAESFFKFRNTLFYTSDTGSDYSHFHKQMIMDGLDHGKLKIVERICDDADIYTNMTEYHARSSGVAVSDSPNYEPVADTDTASISQVTGTEQTCKSNNAPKKLTKKQKSSKLLAKSMSDWTFVKRLNTMLPSQDIGQGVPIFKVKQMLIMLNYLTTSISHLNSTVVSGINDVEDDTDALSQSLSSPNDALAYPDSLYSSPFFCVAEPITISDVFTISVIPSFLLRLEHVLLAANVKQRLGLAAKTETVRQAITAASANTDVNYERLETLGDSVLKYITTIMLFVCYPSDHEGLLTSRRSQLVSNANLFSISKRLNLPEHIVSRVFSRRDIRFPGIGWQRLKNVPRKWVAFVENSLKKEGSEESQSQSQSDNNDSTGSSAVDNSDSGLDSKQDTFSALSSSTSLSSDFSISSKSTDEIVDRFKMEKATLNPKGQKLTMPACSRKHRLSEKTVADIVESLLGASLVDGGLEGALAAARSLGIAKSRWVSWHCFNDVWQANNVKRRHEMEKLTGLCAAMIANADRLPNSEELMQEIEMDQQDIIYSQAQMQLAHGLTTNGSDQWVRDIEAGLGYTFRNQALLIEALTHCSVSDSTSDSYQRLEFLGDAILDFFVTKRYFEYRPELRPYRITLVKHIAVSNDLLSIVTVCHGFHRYIRHRSEVLAQALRDYEVRLGHARSVWARSKQQVTSDADDMASPELDSEISGYGSEKSNLSFSSWEDSMNATTVAAAAMGNEATTTERPVKVRRRAATANDASDMYRDLPPECWNMVPAPKILGDIFESLLGAVYVDSGMDNNVAQAVYERLLCPFLDRFVDSGKLSLHPVIQCLLVCQGWGCDLITWTSRANSDQLEFFNKHICEVKAHGQVVATGMGESPRHAKFNATSLFLHKIGAIAPDALSGELKTMHKHVADSDAIERLLRPICTCAERRAEAAANANSVAAAAAMMDIETAET